VVAERRDRRPLTPGRAAVGLAGRRARLHDLGERGAAVEHQLGGDRGDAGDQHEALDRGERLAGDVAQALGQLAEGGSDLAGAGAAVAPCSRSWRSTGALVLGVAQALVGERCRRWRWSAPTTSIPSRTSPATSIRPGAWRWSGSPIAAAAGAVVELAERAGRAGDGGGDLEARHRRAAAGRRRSRRRRWRRLSGDAGTVGVGVFTAIRSGEATRIRRTPRSTATALLRAPSAV
jgi:hypothetical protein